MLKFVSRKPPKGKTGNQHYSDYHYQEPQAPKVHQTRLFRPRVSSGMRSPPNFDPLKGDKSHIHMSDNAGRDSLGYDATSEGQAECVYDNLDKVRDRSKQMQENGQDISFDSSDLTRSRSPSNLSSESSPYGSLRKKYEKFQDPRRSGHGYRHVTWSPDVTNGDNLPMISEKYVAANSHGQSPYNLATRTYMADDYVHRKPDMSHLRYTVGNVKDCIQTVPGPNVHGSGRTVNMSEQFRGDKRANVSDMYTSRNKPVQSKLMTSTDSNLSDLQLGPCQFPRDLDQSLGEPSSLTDSGPNYAYYTTLPANFSTRSNFVFSPRICSTPVKDLSKTKEKPRLKVIIPPKEKDFQLTNQHTFPSHVTNKCGSDDGNDEYDNIDIETDQKDYRRKTSEVARQEAFKTDNISARHQDVGKWKTQSSQSKTNYPGLFCTSQSEPRQKDQPMQQSPARQSDMMDQGPKQVRRGFPRLFLPKENSWKKTPVSGHPTTCTTTTVESTGFQAEDKRDRHYHHFDSLVRSPRIIPEPKRVETGPVLYQQIRKVGEGQDKDGYPVGRYTEQPPTHKLWEGRDIYNKGGYQEGRFMEQPSSHKVMTSCVPQVNHEVKHEAVKKYQYSPREPPASGSNTPGANMSSLRDMINRAQVEEDHLVLDLVYITERIISMSFPSDEHEVTYSYNLKEVMNMLRTKHDDNCLVINLSEPRQDLEKFNPKHVIDYGWPDYLAPPLERLCNICKAMDSWLSTDPRHVVVVHCKGSTSRIAVIIAAFMHYCSICASADQALDRFAMKRFYDDKLGGITLPSQIRYIEYFYGLLSGAIKINSNPLYLHHIVIHGVPNFDTQGGCRPFIKVYQGMQNIFTSGVYNVTDQMQKVCISISPGIPLRGDIMIKCYHKKAKTGQREVVWACQFHTCAISGYTLTFAKKDLDDARTDPRFPDGGKVEFVFGNSQDSNVRDVSEVTDFKSDVTVPVDDGSDALVRWDSYENFSHVKNADGTVNDVNENSVTSSSREGATRSIREQHSQGPVDGSLYATVTKRKHEHVETTSGSLFQNGTTSHDQQNGSHTSSVDSGISASSSGIAGNTSSNMNTTSTSVNITPQYTSNVNNNDSLHQSFSSTLNSSKSSYNNGVSSGQKKTVPPLDEQTQLDMILSDLLNDSVFVSTPQSPPKSGANSVSKDTRTFRTYDTQATPDGKTTYQTAEVTYKIPGGFKEERNYSMTKTEEKSYVPKNAFSYTSGPTSPELQRKAESPKTHSLPYRTDYDNRYYTNNESSFNRTMDSSRSMSPNEQTSSWLQEQQQKLRQRKDSKDDKTVQQERQLVEELKTAQNKYFMKRANNQAEEQATMETYRTASSPPPVANGPVSSSYVVTQNHAYSTDRSAHEPVRSFSPPGFTGTTQRSTTAEQKEKVERERNRLEELEKSLQAASNSIIATTPWQQQQQQQLQQQQQQKSYSTTERHVTRRVETRKYETQQQQHHQQQQSVSSYDGHGEVPPLSPTPHQRSTSPEWDNMNMHGSVTVEKGNNKDENLPRRSSEVNTLPRSNCNSLPRSEVSENSETSESEARMSFVEANTALNNLLGELTAWTKEKPDVTLNYNLDSWTVTADDVSATEKRNLKCIDHKQEMVEVSPNTLTVSKSRTDQRGDNSGPNSRRGSRDELDVQWGSCSRRSSRDELDCDRNKGSEDFLGGTRTREELLWGSNSRRGSRDEIGSYDGSRRGSRDEIDSQDSSRRGSRDEIGSRDGSRRGSRDEIGSCDGSRRGSRDEVEAGQKVDFYIATSQQVQTPRSLVAKEVGPHIQEVLTDNEKDVPVPSFGFQSQTITDTTGVCPVTGATSAERREQHVAMMHEEQPGMKITHSQQQEYTTATTHFQPEVTIHQKEATTNWSGQMTSESSCNRQTGQLLQETITQAEPVFMIEPGHKSGKHECTINVPGQGELSADQLGMLHTYLSEGGSSLKSVIEKSDRTATSTTAKSETVSKGQANRELTSNAAGLSVNQSCSKGGAETSQGLDWQTKRGTSEFEVDDNGHYAVVDKSQMFNTSSRQQFVTSQYQTIDSVRGSENAMATRQPARLISTTGMGQKQFITSEYQTIDSELTDTQTLTQSKSQTEFTLSKSSKAADEVIYSQVIKKKSQVQAIAPPPPKQISVVEEDKISLRPIGPGVQTLEPEGMGTMGRSGATTPSFPVSPVASADLLYVDDSTPPFPVSPRTPYYNQAGSMTSPFNTMSSTTSSQHHTTQQHQQHMIQHQQPQHQQPQQMQQQHQHQHHQQQQHQQQVIQQQQQQQFQQQQHQQQQPQQQQHSQHQQYQYQQEYHTGVRNQSGSVSSQDASHALHVDTSPRMVSPGGSMARTPTSPPSPSSLNTLRQQLSVGGTMSPTSHSMTGQSSPSLYFGTSRRGSISSLAESEPAHITTPRFVKDMSKYWYKPQITREEAIVLLKDKHPGSFVVRDSNSYPGAFGLALKVAHIPANVQTKSTGDPSADLVRHFLIEPTHKGVRLRGSNNEPIFGSLASLVYQHSNTPLSLPCKLMLPDAETVAMDGSSTMDSSSKSELPSSAAALLAQGAACNVLFLNTVDTESLTGPQAVARAMKVTFDTQPSPKTTVVHFKVSNQGITLTDNQRKLFFRRHYPVAAVTYCGMDPDGRKWKRETETGALMEARVFGFVARKSGGHSDNACHLFAEVDPEQPASAIVNFVTKIMIGQSGKVKP